MYAEVEINQHEVIVGDVQMRVKEFGYTEQEINSVWKGNLKIGIGDGRTLLGLPGIQRKREESEGTSLRTGS
jgi:hypothetical protein